MLKNYDYAKTVDNGDSPDDALWARWIKIIWRNLFDKAGVCRHIHQLSVKIARQVGVKMSYGLSYASPTGYHLTAIMTNPNNPLETVRVNYANIESAHGDDGSATIAQEEGASINSGIAYHVWDDDDTPLYYFANQKGVILEHQTGGDISLLDPNVRYEAEEFTKRHKSMINRSEFFTRFMMKSKVESM